MIRVNGTKGSDVRRILHRLGVLAVVSGLAACTDQPTTPPGTGPVTIVDLPAPRTESAESLEEALLERRSVRAFTGQRLTLTELSQLLWAAQGITAEWGGRTAPSAGALYPLEVYVVTQDGLYHYLPEGHRAELLSRTDLRVQLSRAALGEAAVYGAPAVFVITAVYARTTAKYGDRGERYVQLEAGHVAQNLLLQAVALGLAGVPIGAFSDDDVGRLLDLPSDRVPLYLIPVGHSAE